MRRLAGLSCLPLLLLAAPVTPARAQAVDSAPKGFSRKLDRTGSRIGADAQSCEWQFIQVLVGGMPAKADVSTEVWQYRQSMPSSPTWCRCENCTG